MDIISRCVAVSVGAKYYFTGVACKRGHIDVRLTSSHGCVQCARDRARDHPAAKESRRIWQTKNKEQFARMRRDYAQNNRDKVRQTQKTSRQTHSEARALYKAAYKKKNQEAILAAGAAYRANNKSKIAIANAKWRRSNMDKANDTASKARERNRAAINAHATARYHANISNSRDIGRINATKRRARKAAAEGVFTKQDLLRLMAAQRGKCAVCRVAIKQGYHVDHIHPLSKGGSNLPRNLQLLCESCNCRKHDKDPMVFMRSLGRLL